MVMKQQITEKTQLTTPDHDAVDDASHKTIQILQQSDITLKQHEIESAQHETTLSTSEDVAINETQPAAATTQLLTIQVLCPVCSRENHINMDKLWQKVGTNRFCYIICTSCHNKTRIGTWRSSHDVHKTMVNNGCNAIRITAFLF